MTEPVDRTRTMSDAAQDAPPQGPLLFVALHAGAPLTAPSRHDLRRIDTIEIGRGPEVLASRKGRTLELRLPDPWMSSRHARVTRHPAHWVVEDLDSKNGTAVAGRRLERATITGDTVMRTGQTFFVLRPKNVVDPEAALDVSADELEGPEGLHTLEPGLAIEFEQLRRIARSEVPVVIHGETGAGKELAARAVHELSERPGPCVPLNCGGLGESIAVAELFGHRKGAFSGATADRDGWVVTADHGTLFLDEIAELPPAAQAALLRVVQEHEVVPVGDTRPKAVNVRFVSATHRDLEALVTADRFREDLLARLSGYRVKLPAVRERQGDRGLLIRALLRRRPQARAVSFTATAGQWLMDHAWPRNVRELDKVLSSALALAGDEPVAVEHLPTVPEIAADPSGDEALREQLVALLTEHGGNVSRVARQMGKHRQQIQKWIRRLGIDVDGLRGRG